MKVTLPARGLTKVYHAGEVDVHALRGVDLDLSQGELVVLHPSDRVIDGVRIQTRGGD